MADAWRRRLDVVPTTKLAAFTSDAYVIDWSYGRLKMTQRVLANILAERIDAGFLDKPDALAAAHEILFDTPRAIFLPDEVIKV